MNRIFYLICCLGLVSMMAQAQTRYEDEVFTDVTMTPDVKYGEAISIRTGTPTQIDLLMDVYEPTDDTLGGAYYDANGRPVILLFHAGSFLPKGPFLPFGDKRDSVMIELGMQFAKRGFVAVSVEYRIGWNPLAPGQEEKAASIIQAVYRAQQDARACVRWFRKDAANGNQYNIDPYRIVVGGSNSGGYLALAVGSLNKPAEINLLKFLNSSTGNSFIDTSTLGGFYGEGGVSSLNILNNPGYSSTPQCILNLGGAIGDTSWIEAGEPPIVSFHGIADALTPFGTDIVIVSATGDPVVEVSGSRDVALKQDLLGNNDIWVNAGFSDPVTTIAGTKSPAYEGLFWFGSGYGTTADRNGFEPWAWYDTNEPTIIDAANPSSNPNWTPPYTGTGSALNPYASRTKAEVYIDTIMQYFIPRLLVAFDNIDSTAVETADPDTEPVGVHELAFGGKLSIYPNPANDVLVIENNANQAITNIRVYDLSGREVLSNTNVGVARTTINVGDLNNGLYFVTVETEAGAYVRDKILIQK